jgi:hypothetical protein
MYVAFLHSADNAGNTTYFQYGAKIRSEEQEAQYAAMCAEEAQLRAERGAGSDQGGDDEGGESDSDSDDGIVTSTPQGKGVEPAGRPPKRFVEEEEEEEAPTDGVLVLDDEDEEYQSEDEGEAAASGVFRLAGGGAQSAPN